ncbi:hypothetical protein BDY19DRAFT_911943 [Irpex rosettiformis]|uniref:Uncharacterized protein n=1 Tax=Irpex rosettiformis TaxID=378272 RepID=A0ACB8UJ91_9APHY|nr:hypothetical protein BDY19DRAFT_911943 [Irpex rosettiformis]
MTQPVHFSFSIFLYLFHLLHMHLLLEFQSTPHAFPSICSAASAVQLNPYSQSSTALCSFLLSLSLGATPSSYIAQSAAQVQPLYRCITQSAVVYS